MGPDATSVVTILFLVFFLVLLEQAKQVKYKWGGEQWLFNMTKSQHPYNHIPLVNLNVDIILFTWFSSLSLPCLFLILNNYVILNSLPSYLLFFFFIINLNILFYLLICSFSYGKSGSNTYKSIYDLCESILNNFFIFFWLTLVCITLGMLIKYTFISHLNIDMSNLIVYIATILSSIYPIIYIFDKCSQISSFNISALYSINWSLFTPRIKNSITWQKFLITIIIICSVFYIKLCCINFITAKINAMYNDINIQLAKDRISTAPKERFSLVPRKSGLPSTSFSGIEYAKLSMASTRLSQQYNLLTADTSLINRAAFISSLLPNNPWLIQGNIPVIGLNVPNIRGPIFLNYGVNVTIHPSVFIQGDVKILDSPISKVEIGANSAIGFNCVIATIGHLLDVSSRSAPIGEGTPFAKDVIIGKGVYVFTNSIILPGTVLGDYSIVTAGSTVNGLYIPAGFVTNGKSMWPISDFDDLPLNIKESLAKEGYFKDRYITPTSKAKDIE